MCRSPPTGITQPTLLPGSNVPQTRTPDAHFTEVRYKGTKTIAITPDYSEVAKLCDQWLAPKQGTDSALAMAMGHVILKSFISIIPATIFLTIAAVIPTCQCWSCWMSAQTAVMCRGV